MLLTLVILIAIVAFGIGAIFLTNLNLSLAENKSTNTIAQFKSRSGTDAALVTLAEYWDENLSFPTPGDIEGVLSTALAGIGYGAEFDLVPGSYGIEVLNPGTVDEEHRGYLKIRGFTNRGSNFVTEALFRGVFSPSTTGGENVIFGQGLVSPKGINCTSGVNINVNIWSGNGVHCVGKATLGEGYIASTDTGDCKVGKLKCNTGVPGPEVPIPYFNSYTDPVTSEVTEGRRDWVIANSVDLYGVGVEVDASGYCVASSSSHVYVSAADMDPSTTTFPPEDLQFQYIPAGEVYFTPTIYDPADPDAYDPASQAPPAPAGQRYSGFEVLDPDTGYTVGYLEEQQWFLVIDDAANTAYCLDDDVRVKYTGDMSNAVIVGTTLSTVILGTDVQTSNSSYDMGVTIASGTVTFERGSTAAAFEGQNAIYTYHDLIMPGGVTSIPCDLSDSSCAEAATTVFGSEQDITINGNGGDDIYGIFWAGSEVTVNGSSITLKGSILAGGIGVPDTGGPGVTSAIKLNGKNTNIESIDVIVIDSLPDDPTITAGEGIEVLSRR